jgi:hypothetical protein
MITVQVGLVIGLWFVLTGKSAPVIFALLVPALGVWTAVYFAVITTRARQWAAWYVKRCNALSEPNPPNTIFPAHRGEISLIEWGFVSRLEIAMAAALSLGWVIIFIWIICAKI